MYDVIVVGGGIIGCSVAWQLAKRKQRVLVIERTDVASGSAGATDGFVGCYTKKPGPQLDLAIKSVQMFDTLQEELGEDIAYQRGAGGMQPVEDQTQWDMLEKTAQLQQQHGLDVRMISAQEAHKIVPGLSTDIHGALYCPDAGKVNPMNLSFAYCRAARKYGAEFMNRTLVTGFLIEDGRVRGIQTEKGIFYADVIVNACGSWAGKVAGLAGLDMPIKPRKGQLAVTEPIGFYMSPTIQCARYNVIKFHPETIKDETVLRLGSSMNIAQTEEGGLLIGGTREFAGFEGENTLEAIDTMMKRVLRFFPGLKDVHVIRYFSGFRPYTPDGLSLLGEVKTLPGFYMAAGHEGDGIALSPITGQLIAELIVDGRCSHDITPFSPNRFSA